MKGYIVFKKKILTLPTKVNVVVDKNDLSLFLALPNRPHSSALFSKFGYFAFPFWASLLWNSMSNRTAASTHPQKREINTKNILLTAYTHESIQKSTSLLKKNSASDANLWLFFCFLGSHFLYLYNDPPDKPLILYSPVFESRHSDTCFVFWYKVVTNYYYISMCNDFVVWSHSP